MPTAAAAGKNPSRPEEIGEGLAQPGHLFLGHAKTGWRLNAGQDLCNPIVAARDDARLAGRERHRFGFVRSRRGSAAWTAPLPDGDNMGRALLLQDALHAADRVALAVEKMTDALEQIDIAAGGRSAARRRASSA